ncbi:MAG: family 10 glycosylhydrolase [Filimonas sp.]|nr:family 10 glycosylhydrolase [Filimonas sp.]
MLKRFAALSALSLLLLAGCATSRKTTTTVTTTDVPQVQKEFRAAWVATVANINWPSKPGLSSEQQQQEALALLDFLKEHHFNAVILQVRPQADALYKSDIEPWSYFLTGQQGKPPVPFYDPLEYWVKAAHERGVELHVWLNPYRAHHVDGKEISEQSIVKKHPELVMKLKEGYWWMDPSRKEVQDYTSSVVKDIVKRYDIDGVHFDDYFYPYPSYNKNEDFPDSASWAAYQRKGGKLSRDDWRRDGVNTLIERLYKEIKAEKKWVKFGLSPFGMWRPGYPSSIEGFDQYDKLYADAKLWLNKGWIDYFAPQLYWPINKIPQSFPVLLGWWQQENTMQRHLWPGINVGRDTGYKTVNETINEIMVTRGMLPQSAGAIHWSISSDVKNTVLAQTLIDGVYKKDALVPASPWLDSKAPAAPTVKKEVAGSNVNIQWSHTEAKDVFRWIIYFKYGKNWDYKIVNQNDRSFSLPTAKGTAILTAVAVSAVGRTGNESERATINVQ